MFKDSLEMICWLIISNPRWAVNAIIIIIIIINDIYRVQTSPRSKCAKSAVARLQLS